jgi:hypothetical protein
LNESPTVDLLNQYREQFGPIPRWVFEQTSRAQRQQLIEKALQSGEPAWPPGPGLAEELKGQ